MTTRVVNIKARPAPRYDIYIGRGSIWGNPYKIGHDGTREEVIARYMKMLTNSPALRARVPELRGKVLGCYCKPEPCHGDVLAQFADMMVTT